MIFIDVCKGCSKFLRTKLPYSFSTDYENVCTHLGYKSHNSFYERHSPEGCLRKEQQRERFEEEKKKVVLDKAVCKQCFNKAVMACNEWIEPKEVMLWDEQNDKHWDENLECACPCEHDDSDQNDWRDQWEMMRITRAPNFCKYKMEHDIMLSDKK